MLHAARLVSPAAFRAFLRQKLKRACENAPKRSQKRPFIVRRQNTKSGVFSAYTCRGAVLLSATAASFGRVYTLDNELGLADDFLQAVLERARSAGAARIVCPDPVDPEKLAALILPEDGLSLVAVSDDFRFDGKAARHFRLGTAAELSDAQRKEVRRAAALRRSLAAEACSRCGGRRSCTTNWRRHIIRLWISALTRFEQKHLENIFSA